MLCVLRFDPAKPPLYTAKKCLKCPPVSQSCTITHDQCTDVLITSNRSDITNSLSSFAVLIEMLTRTFLLEEDLHPKHSNLLRAVKDHESTFTSLKKSLSEAKSEWWNSKIQHNSVAYDSAIDSMTRLAQHVGGLRSGLNLQRELAMRSDGVTWSSAAPRNSTSLSEVDALQKAFGDFVDELSPPMHSLTVGLESRGSFWHFSISSF